MSLIFSIELIFNLFLKKMNKELDFLFGFLILRTFLEDVFERVNPFYYVARHYVG